MSEGFIFELRKFDEEMGLEAYTSQPQQTINMNFKPVNITIENGVYYATIYVCELICKPELSDNLSIWLSSLKDTDHVKLSVNSTSSGYPAACVLDILAAFKNSKAHIELIVDNVLMDVCAYFYLAADSVTIKPCGAIFIPSYVPNRRDDVSVPWLAIHDFYQWLTEEAVKSNRLNEEQARLLNDGHHVIIDLNNN